MCVADCNFCSAGLPRPQGVTNVTYGMSYDSTEQDHSLNKLDLKANWRQPVG